tara:strand:+ start:231 stop:704 length:474 start_codon:yes stop_codon:yes gene_type:complete
MKKRTAFVGAILSLIPIGHPLIIKTGLVLSSSAVMLSLTERVNAERTSKFYFDRGFEKGNKGDYYGAISDFTKALEINSSDANAYYNRGWNKHKIKDYYGAISDYTKAIEIKPAADAYVNRAFSKEKIGDLKGACSDWREAFNLGYQEAALWLEEAC